MTKFTFQAMEEPAKLSPIVPRYSALVFPLLWTSCGHSRMFFLTSKMLSSFSKNYRTVYPGVFCRKVLAVSSSRQYNRVLTCLSSSTSDNPVAFWNCFHFGHWSGMATLKLLGAGKGRYRVAIRNDHALLSPCGIGVVLWLMLNHACNVQLLSNY